VFLPVQTFTPLFSLAVPNFVVFFRLSYRKFDNDSKNVLKTIIFLLQVGFISDFVPDCSYKLCFWQFKFSHRFSPWLYQILEFFFRLLDRKFDDDSKNVLKTIFFLLQVGFIGDFVSDCSFKLFLAVQIFTPLFSLAVPNFVVFFLGYRIRNLMRIPKMCLKQSFSDLKWVL